MSLVLALAGCGSSGDLTTTDATGGYGDDASVAVKSIIATTPNTGGTVSAPFDMQLIAIHMAVQPDGRVLYFGSDLDGSQTAAHRYGVYDPALGATNAAVMALPNGVGNDLFCSSQTLMLDGRTVVFGGDTPPTDTNIASPQSTAFDGRTNTLAAGHPMNRPRWYSSSTMLMTGEIYVQGGGGGFDRPELLTSLGSFKLLSGADTSSLNAEYPRNWIAPDGRVFGIDRNNNVYTVDPYANGGLGAIQRNGMLPPSFTADIATMFAPGRILTVAYEKTALIVDIRNGAPTFRPTESVRDRRVSGVGTVLPDGRVLISGGGDSDKVYTLSLEVWNPRTSEWTIGPSIQNPRLYHGTAILLPDARVLIAGGGAPGPFTQKNGEVFTPPYLYTASGALAPRPAIAEAPTVVEPGASFPVRVAGQGVSRVTLVRTGSVTHSWNSDQRHLDLPFSASGNTLSVQLPARATDTPPGFYMLFVFDAQGVPSVAKILRVNPPGARPATAPEVDAIDDRSWSAGVVALQPSARSPVGRPLRWTAAGLPTGLRIDPAIGAITGTPTVRGDWFVTVAADDGAWTGSSSFLWRIDPPQVAVDGVRAGGPAAVGQAATFTAVASGNARTYSWNFGDGTPVTRESTSPSTSHVFAAPGAYLVTVTVYDAQRRPVTQTVLQRVGLPRTAGQPTRSTMITLTRRVATPRLWVANPDADTVTMLDPVTLDRLAEVKVGRRPVTLAEAADGNLWVVNRESASISIVAGNGGGVLATLPMAPGSLPHGIAMNPAGTKAFVASEGANTLTRFDTAGRRQESAFAGDGLSPRHVAVRGDGGAVYASTFITPALPGESTATPSVAGQGGRVVRFDPSSLQPVTTIRLAHSDRPDAENQGRGIPNYLGAMTISPDGSQSFVPSKQDNVLRGTQRDGRNLDFQNTVRAISSRVVMETNMEDPAARIDHDNASVASAATFDATGTLLFVALETSREIAVVDAHRRVPLMRIDTGIAPQGVEVSADGKRLFVANFMDRTVTAYDLAPLLDRGQLSAPLLEIVRTVANELLAADVLKGKQLFYDARDPRLARDRYMSCASCHADGGHDGRTWDLTGFGEGLRNTISLRGRGGMGAGPLHWSGNFDEVQDFEGQIRALAGGTGLMSDADLNWWTRRQPLGTRKAGVSAELDALAAYVGSLTNVDRSPARPAAGPSEAAVAGAQVFAQLCAQCHAGPLGTDSAPGLLHDLGTRKAASGNRLGKTLAGLDAPPLHDAWATPPYLHDGSASTLEAAISAHVAGLDATLLSRLTAYVREGAGSALGAPTVVARAVSLGASATTLGGVAERGGFLTPGGVAAAAATDSVALTHDRGQVGVRWTTSPWSTAQPFSTSFDFRMESWNPMQADGVGLVFRKGGSRDIGPGGACMGVCYLSDGLGAFIRTWSYNVGGFYLPGGQWRGRPLGFDAGRSHRIVGRMTVNWSPTTRLLSMSASMLVDGVPRRYADQVTVDLATIYGPSITVGVLGATGGDTAFQAMSNWTMTPTAVNPRRTIESLDLGGYLTSPIECLTWGEAGGSCFAVGGDGKLWQMARWEGDGISAPSWFGGYPLPGQPVPGWIEVGGRLAPERPSCVSASPGRVDCFAIGTDKTLWRLRWDGTRWTIDSMGGVLTSAPSCVVAGDGVARCFARGSDNALWQIRGDARPWDWSYQGGVLTSAPSCVVQSDGAPWCFVRGSDTALWGIAPGRQGWFGLEGAIGGAPSCTVQSGGRMSCAVRGLGENALWRRDFDGLRWSDWIMEADTVGLVAAAPRCTAHPQREGVDCAFVSADGTMRVKSRDLNDPASLGWVPSVAATPVEVEAPACASLRGRVDCVARQRGAMRFTQRAWTVD